MTIQVLTDFTIDQIAAGEVVENPASVIKELVDNALDAGAQRVDIEITAGGLQLIRVMDDGSGMCTEDLMLCTQRHATSKLRHIEDLRSLSTMGFRGEALSSIASVSHMQITTSQKELGMRICVEDGKLIRSIPYARTRGTTFEVHSLFYNMPARREFQKNQAGCTADIMRMLTGLMLARPDVGFTLRQQNSTLIDAPAVSIPKERIAQVLGKEYSSMLSFIETDGLTGFLGSPLYTKGHRLGQYLYINGRHVQAPAISKAVSLGYGTRISAQSHPVFVLYIQQDPKTIDINVHPQKKRVRFQNEEAISKQIEEKVRTSLQKMEGYISSKYTSTPKQVWIMGEEVAPLELREEKIEAPLLPIPKKSRRPLCFIKEYFLIEEDSNLWILNVQEARARKVFDTLSNIDSVEKQSLLLPISLILSPQEASGLEAYCETMEKMGFEIRLAGKNHFFVEAIPSCLDIIEAEASLKNFIQEGCWDAHHLAIMASKKAASHFKSPTIEEGCALFDMIKQNTLAHVSAQGKPFLIQVTSDDIRTLLFSSK